MSALQSAALLGVAILIVAGCAAPAREEALLLFPVAASTPPVQPSRPSGVSVEGQELCHTVHGYGAETVLLIGGIHGNEPAGTPLLMELAAFLDTHPRARTGKRVIVAPAVNPDGLARGQRHNTRGVDLNRNYDTKNRLDSEEYGRTPLSEPEARFIAELIHYYKPTRILSMHQPLNCIDWDGPAKDLASAMAEACGMKLKKLGARPGSLGAYAGVDLNIPIITWELPRKDSKLDAETLWERYKEALLVFVQWN